MRDLYLIRLNVNNIIEKLLKLKLILINDH